MVNNVTNREVLTAIHELRQDWSARLDKIEQQLLRLNGTVRCHETDIALLKAETSRHGMNWGRVMNVVLAVVQALAIAGLLVALNLK